MSEPFVVIEIDARKLLKMLVRAQHDLPPLAMKALGASVGIALREARRSRAFEDRTKRLRQSIRRGGSGYAGFMQFIAAGGKDAPYARFVESGTRAHTIRARRKPLLRFQVAGQWVSAKEVEHPGTLPAWFMRDAARTANVALLDMLHRAADRAFHSGGGEG